MAFRAQDKGNMELPLDMVSFFPSICLARVSASPFPMIESLSKTTKYEDEGILDNFCRLRIILRMHTELDVTGGRSTCLPMCRCL